MLKSKAEFDYQVLAEHLWYLSEAAFPYGSPWNVSQFKADLENEFSFYFIQEEEQELVGYLVIHQLFDQGEVINVAVAPTYKGQKVAYQLFQAALKELAAKGLTSLFLEVRENNQPALNLYRKLGFVEIGRRKKYYHHPVEDGLVMSYQLRDELGGK